MTWIYRQDQESPSIAIAWYDRNGDLLDFSTGYTFTLKLINDAGTTVLTKTTGITGANASPNVVAAWTTGELASVPAAAYRVLLKATNVSGDRYFRPGDEPVMKILAAG